MLNFELNNMKWKKKCIFATVFVVMCSTFVLWKLSPFTCADGFREIREMRKKGTALRPTRISESPSLWFRERMDFSVDVFWTEGNIEVNQKVLNWWTTRDKDKNFREALNDLFNVGVPSKITDEPRDSRKVRSCAVVGNSDNLLRYSHGKFIDEHTYVMRFNKAVTKGYEEYVGSKTTHHFLYPQSAPDALERNTSLVLLPFTLHDVMWLTSALGGKSERFQAHRHLIEGAPKTMKCDKSKIRVIHPEFMRYVAFSWLANNGRFPSTGLFGLIFALHHCDQVDVFGFGTSCDKKWLHYYETEIQYSGIHNEHDDSPEKRLMAMLEAEGLIKIHGVPETGRVSLILWN